MGEEDPASVGLVYVEGHGRVYHGPLGPLPRLYVARQKLRLRGTTDSWVNGLGGEPFLVVTQPLHTGRIAALREQVIPRWLAEAPQPDAGRLAADPEAVRFTMVFDREGFSPKLFADLLAQRIAILPGARIRGWTWPRLRRGCRRGGRKKTFCATCGNTLA